jgi:hypothetical protein
MNGYIREAIESIEDKSLSIKDQVKFELVHLEYTKYTNEKAGNNFYIVIEYKTYKDQTKPYVTLHHIKTGSQLKTKVKNSNAFIENPFKLYSVLKVNKFTTQKKMKNIGGKWERIDEDEQILSEWEVY